jgi:hypothetical protein
VSGLNQSPNHPITQSPEHPITKSLDVFDPIIAPVRLILASASPRRAELLRAAGYEFEIIVADVDECARGSETPDAYGEGSRGKSAAVMTLVRGLKGGATYEYGGRARRTC